MSEGNPFLLPGTPAGPPLDPQVESGTRRVPRADPDVGPSTAEEATVLAPPARTAPTPSGPRSPARWRLIMPDGAEILLDQPVLLGRDPSAPDGVRGARAIAVRDPEQTVSKTHALLSPDPGGIRVRDLHSTNGTTIQLREGRTPVPADGELVAGQPGTLLLGRFAIRLEA